MVNRPTVPDFIKLIYWSGDKYYLKNHTDKASLQTEICAERERKPCWMLDGAIGRILSKQVMSELRE